LSRAFRLATGECGLDLEKLLKDLNGGDSSLAYEEVSKVLSELFQIEFANIEVATCSEPPEAA
jgi:hypothetical protein